MCELNEKTTRPTKHNKKRDSHIDRVRHDFAKPNTSNPPTHRYLSFRLVAKASSLRGQEHNCRYLPSRNSNHSNHFGDRVAFRHHNHTKKSVNEFLIKQLKHETTNPMVFVRITQIARTPSVSISLTAPQCYIVVRVLIIVLATLAERRPRKSTNNELAKA